MNGNIVDALDSSVNIRKVMEGLSDEKKDIMLLRMKETCRDLTHKVTILSGQMSKDQTTIKQLKFDKSTNPKMDSIVQFKMHEKEYQLKYEKIRDENITLKAIQVKQTNALLG